MNCLMVNMMDNQIESIEIRYYNGNKLTICQNELERIAKLGEALTWIERAKQVYNDLKPLFSKV